jgi:hypothetical protein
MGPDRSGRHAVYIPKRMRYCARVNGRKRCAGREMKLWGNSPVRGISRWSSSTGYELPLPRPPTGKT